MYHKVAACGSLFFLIVTLFGVDITLQIYANAGYTDCAVLMHSFLHRFDPK